MKAYEHTQAMLAWWCEIGIDRVERLHVLVNSERIVSKTPSEKYNESRIGNYFIKTHCSTAQKKRNLEQIANELGVILEIEII